MPIKASAITVHCQNLSKILLERDTKSETMADNGTKMLRAFAGIQDPTGNECP